MIKFSLPLILLSFCFATHTFAQTDTPKQNNNQVFNNIYRQNLPTLFFGNEYGGGENTLLVADINPNVVLFSSKKSRFFFAFSPRVHLRLMADYKSPVRSPSYMPGGSLFMGVNSDAMHPKFFSLSYTHHSNGERGSTLDATGEFNREDGKFTTNFYNLNYYFGKREVSNTVSKTHSAFVGAEVHAGLFKTGYSKELDGKYGFIRTNGRWFYDVMQDKNGTSDWYHSRQRLQVDVSYIWDKVYDYNVADVGKRLNASLKYYYQFGFMQNAALTATAGYRGQDPYNIFFQDNYAYFAVGVAAGLSFDLRKKHLRD